LGGNNNLCVCHRPCGSVRIQDTASPHFPIALRPVGWSNGAQTQSNDDGSELELRFVLSESKQSSEFVCSYRREETKEKYQNNPEDQDFIWKVSTNHRKNESDQDVVWSQAKSSSNPRVHRDTREKDGHENGDEQRHYQVRLTELNQPQSYQRQREKSQWWIIASHGSNGCRYREGRYHNDSISQNTSEHGFHHSFSHCVSLGLWRRHLIFYHRFLETSNELVLPFYIVHQTVIVSIAFHVFSWNLIVIDKYIIIALSSFGVICALLFLISRINVPRFLFGMRLRKR